MAGKSEDTKKKAAFLNESDSDSEKGLEEEDSTGLSLTKLNLSPKKKLVVLSLGGLLCHRVCRKDRSTDHPIYRITDASYGSFVGGWYMSNALDCIMVGLRSKVLFAWDQNQCTDSGFKTLENEFKPIFFKELEKIWDNKYYNLPSPVEQYSSKNTLLIDTNPYKALLNPPNTAVFPTDDYKANHVNDDALGPKGELRLYLEGLVDADDVPSYVKNHTFGQPAITSMHPDWVFYSNIIRKD
ncbi:hypothetical protein LWI28_009254 [Acer negundo]|uniref:FCP1 homology domain-containing protein n=1 Tax=Acer negundo TaxID=4023 RepID=A0AAD5I5L6_ACENE|nr:hypothetical protein LWI28_009254 [Acer negundo]